MPRTNESGSAEEGARKQLEWMQYMERLEQECFPDARPRSEVIVRLEETMEDKVLVRDINYEVAREKIHDYFDYWKAAGSTHDQILSRVAEELSEHDERPLYNADA
jgi:hypothetical protein